MPPKRNVAKKQQQKTKTNLRNSPLSLNSRMSFKPARISSRGGRTTVAHEEVIHTVYGSVLFDNDTFAINPGLVTTFPWLSFIARDYESYVYKNLKFRYVPTCAKTVGGVVTLGCDYDAADVAAGSTIELNTYEDSKLGACHDDILVNCSPHNLVKFCPQKLNRYGALASNLDIKTYDTCTFQCSREGFADTALYGYIVAEYVVEFQTPQLNLAGDYYNGAFNSGGLADPFTTITSEAGIIAARVDADEIVFLSAGNYLVVASMIGTVTVDANPTFTVGSAVCGVNNFGQNAGATTKVVNYECVGVKSGDLLHLDWTGAANTCASTRIRIYRK